jgi:hypothetical protein
MSAGAVWVVDWVRAGDEAERAADGDAFTYFDGPAVDAEWSADGAERVERWEPSEHVDPPGVERRRSIVLAGMTLALVAAVVAGTLWWVDENPGVGRSWAAWNYRGYETKPAWPEYSNLVATMDELGRDAPGRALWEPSDDLNAYGTTLALELLPYWTDGRIGSMEGLYFESAATTPYHFLTVSELAADGNPSNPVRGLLYGTIRDFDLGVRHMQMLGVRYYLAQSDVAKRRADAHPDLDLVAGSATRTARSRVGGRSTRSPTRRSSPASRSSPSSRRPRPAPPRSASAARYRRSVAIRSCRPGSAQPRPGGATRGRSTRRSRPMDRPGGSVSTSPIWRMSRRDRASGSPTSRSATSRRHPRRSRSASTARVFLSSSRRRTSRTGRLRERRVRTGSRRT